VRWRHVSMNTQHGKVHAEVVGSCNVSVSTAVLAVWTLAGAVEAAGRFAVALVASVAVTGYSGTHSVALLVGVVLGLGA
jgi:hypothetical protein